MTQKFPLIHREARSPPPSPPGGKSASCLRRGANICSFQAVSLQWGHHGPSSRLIQSTRQGAGAAAVSREPPASPLHPPEDTACFLLNSDTPPGEPRLPSPRSHVAVCCLWTTPPGLTVKKRRMQPSQHLLSHLPCRPPRSAPGVLSSDPSGARGPHRKAST